jgi:hypothetical protein
MSEGDEWLDAAFFLGLHQAEAALHLGEWQPMGRRSNHRGAALGGGTVAWREALAYNRLLALRSGCA